MTPGNTLFTYSARRFTRHFLCLILLVTSIDVFAMSWNSEPYTPSQWKEGADPETDARHALENDDTRLLAFATRGTSIPGIDSKLIKNYQQTCGFRFLKSFGDVVRNASELQKMKQARDYAMHYNQVIISECKISK